MAPEDYQPTTRERLSLFRRLGRRSDESAPVVLQAAGYNVDLGDESAIQATLRNRQQWQDQVWDALDVCGELSNAVMALGHLLSRIPVFPAEYPDEPDGEPIRTTDPDVVRIAERLGTPQEISILLKQAAIQKLLPGEYQLIGIQPGPGRPNKTREEYFICSISELKSEGDSAVVEHPSGANIKLVKGQDTWVRVWTPHPRKARLAYSPVRPLLNNIDELVWWDMAASAVSKSRLGQMGMVMFPSNIEAPIQADDPPGLTGSARAVARWMRSVTKGIREPGTPSSSVPMAMTYPWNDKGVSGVEVINFPRNDDELMEKRTDRNLHRIAQGFPLPIEFFFGSGDATYGGASQISRDKLTENVEPFVVDLISDWTRHWFRPILSKSGKDPNKFLFWYDPSNLLVIPRWEEQANKGVELGLVSPKAWRRINNISEADKLEGGPENADELLSWIRALRGREGNPSVQEDGEPTDEDAHLGDRDVELKDGESHPPRSKPPAASRGKGQPVMASVVTNGRDLGQRLAEIDADLMSRLQVMASEETRQALRKAGNFISNRARKNPSLRASIKNVAPEDVASTLGREHVNTLGTDGMFDDTFTDVPTKFSLWCDRAVDASIEAAELPTSIVASGTFQLAYSTDDAATQLVRDLKELAASLLFAEPSTSQPAPESTDSLVPARIIRRALAAVGNPSPNGHTDLLLATGRTFTRHLADAGHFVSGHRWIYPTAPYRHPFSTHRNLDGKVIQVDDDAMVPGTGTDACMCLAAPIFE